MIGPVHRPRLIERVAPREGYHVDQQTGSLRRDQAKPHRSKKERRRLREAMCAQTVRGTHG